MKLGLEERIWTCMSGFQKRANPPEPGDTGGTRKCDENCSSSNFFNTTESAFFVSWRKMKSVENFLLRSKSLWTVLGFPTPQQFQLKMPKEGGLPPSENPKADHWEANRGGE